MTHNNRAIGQHAIVMGGSMAGLLAARILSDHFERVTLIERDQFPETAVQRKGVPQGRHIHALLVKGEQIMSNLFPGLADDLIAAGAVQFDFCRDLLWFQSGGYKARFPGGIMGLALSRPLLESHIRRRLLERQNITCLTQYTVTGLIATEDNQRITGVSLRSPHGEKGVDTLTADLIVDATGRGSRSPQWLEALGYARPEESVVQIQHAYASRIYRRDQALMPDALSVMTAPMPPDGQRAGALAPLEGERWMATLGGWTGDHPPTDEPGFLEYARSLPTQDIYQIISRAEPLSDIVIHKMPANLRRHYEKMKQFPKGYLVMGDAVSSFNPAYGQGMTVSAMEAELLEECLHKAPSPSHLDNLAPAFFKEAAKIVEGAWSLAVREDFRFPGVTGPKPPATELINRYVTRFHQSTFHDQETSYAFFQVMNLIQAPTLLFHPRIVWRVIRGGLARP